MFANVRYGSQLSNISKKYPLQIAPNGNTFGIWGVIYSRLFFNSLSSYPPEKSEQFIKSLRASSNWLREFTNENFDESLKLMQEISDANEKLANHPDNSNYYQYTFDVYNTWIKCALLLNKSTVNIVNTGKEDSLKRLVDFNENIDNNLR